MCRYLVDSKWLKQWKKYVGYESWEAETMGLESMHPGPIDNSGLFQGLGYLISLSNVSQIIIHIFILRLSLF